MLARTLSQILLGLMLLFATATLLPRGIIFYKTGRRKRAALYMLMCIVATLLSIMSFQYAYLHFIGQ